MRHYWVDRITEIEPGERAIGVKAVSLTMDALHDHFPGNPVLPGIFIIEGLAQTGGALLSKAEDARRFALMSSVDRARFSSFARPGEVIEYAVEVERRDGDSVIVMGTARVGPRRVAKARITFRMVPTEQVVGSTYLGFWTETLRGWFMDAASGDPP